MSDHAPLSPSKLPSLAMCAGKYHAELEAKKAGVVDVSSPAAEQGTKRHALKEWKLHNPPAPWPTTVMVDGELKPVSSDDVAAVSLLWPYFRDHQVHKDQVCGQVWVEQHVEIGKYCGLDEGLCAGTFDWGAAWAHGCEVEDDKYGRHIVSPSSLQLKAYGVGLGALLDWGGKHRGINDAQGTITLTIGQPAAPTPIRSEVFPINIIQEWAGEIGRVGEAALDPNAPRVPGDDQCHFCLAKDTELCPERKAFLVSQVQSSLAGVFTPVEQPAPREDQFKTHETEGSPAPVASIDAITDIAETKLTEDPKTWSADELGKMCDIAPLVIGVLQEAQKLARKRLEEGQEVTGWRLGKGKRSKDWKLAEEEREAALKRTGLAVKEIYPKKMATLTQLDAIVKTKTKKRQEAFAELWSWKDGKPVLVPEGDTTTPDFRGDFEPVQPGLPDWLK